MNSPKMFCNFLGWAASVFDCATKLLKQWHLAVNLPRVYNREYSVLQSTVSVLFEEQILYSNPIPQAARMCVLVGVCEGDNHIERLE